MTECPICNWDIGTCEDCLAVTAMTRAQRRNRIGFWITAAAGAIYLIVFFGIILKQTLQHS